MSETACVYIVDDEEAIRDSLALLLRSVGIPTRLFPDGGSFLTAYHAGMRGCVVLDVRMPRMGGLELQQELNRRGCSLPLIFMSGHGDVPMAVEAMRAGAMDFLQKPFHDEDMIRRVQRAMEQGERDSAALEEREGLRRRFETLTPREREVAERIVSGDANKVIAIDLDLSERTVELHRARIMQKMEARGLAHLVQMMLHLQG
ncbi:response regulator transcription factor [Solimonas sp. SE-A11]|uniref:response regulator transcription factor n=1 Tax=Solimonas sp. SE-A11 TaxID=3054954 RepID=UPI00259CD506|nr:response regulator [Solimonas sp. SE-A11]MDM4769117.1 response regulator [Solimonas sp. SE-A11]